MTQSVIKASTLGGKVGGKVTNKSPPKACTLGEIGKKSLTSHSPHWGKKLLTKACTLGKNQHRNIDPISQALVLSQMLTAIKCRRNSVSQGSCTTSLGYSSEPDRVVTAIENWRSPCSLLALALVPPTPSYIPPIQWLPSQSRRRHIPCSLQIQFSQQSHWTFTDCIGTFPHKKPPSSMG